MNKFIAYFDFLGYKEFILKNPIEECDRRISHILRDIEGSLGEGKYKLSNKPGIILADTSNSKLNCIVISDTVVFWTNDDTVESLLEILRVTHDFNWHENLYNFPVRGALVYDEIVLRDSHTETKKGGTYSVNAIYGKGLVNAHLKAECCSWAGFVIGKSVIDFIEVLEKPEKFLEEWAVKYLVPYKKPPASQELEFVYRLTKGLNPEALKNCSDGIVRNFKQDNKSIDGARVQEILNNTLKYLETELE